MRFHVLTLFPEMVMQGLHTSIIGRAVERNCISIEAVNIRDYSTDKHGKVDDYTYGGGAGMLMQAQPVYDAWQSVVQKIGGSDNREWSATGRSAKEPAGSGRKPPRTIYVTPQGTAFTQEYAFDLAKEEELIFLCGHYEGIDARVLDEIVTDYVSIGDYVLTGGELPAMVMIDAISRLVQGVLHNDESAETESFHIDLLEYPQYSRPEVWRGKAVPKVLLSGDRRRIVQWRLEQSKLLTMERRPDLYERYRRREELIKRLSANKRQNCHMMESLACGRGTILADLEGEIANHGTSLTTVEENSATGAADDAKKHGTSPTTVEENSAVGAADDAKKHGTSPIDGEGILIYDKGVRMCMASTENEEIAEYLLPNIPQDTAWIITSQEFWNKVLEKQGFEVAYECLQACYTQRNLLPVKCKDICPLTADDLPYLREHCEGLDEEYLLGRIAGNAMYGLYVGDDMVGFVGWHSTGAVGMLYVDEAHRRQGFGSSLESFAINRLLETGHMPYCHIPTGNEEARRLQEKLGLYLSKSPLWYLNARRRLNDYQCHG